ncbi:MAG: hypothetical protein M3N02_01580, partial [Pseudomonadota bacterium]|nr:hypothetical protein [Pseudomonadota bacterium]
MTPQDANRPLFSEPGGVSFPTSVGMTIAAEAHSNIASPAGLSRPGLAHLRARREAPKPAARGRSNIN